ncbi:hypothetical protein JT358_00465 [Micrococcales bacterium 31B]|nr:hypothetical protein [Micrococcales bacterium 31B]
MSGWHGLNQRDDSVPAPVDPLRLCVHTTVALIACVAGPLAVCAFALVAIRGYVRARRAGLVSSRCILGDTRAVITYLVVVAVLALAATPLWVKFWLFVWGG